jgi:hypothetical protein
MPSQYFDFVLRLGLYRTTCELCVRAPLKRLT